MDIKKEWFDGKRSYKAFLYGVSIFRKIKDLQDKGYLVIGETGKAYIDINGKNSELGFEVDNCKVIYSGHTHGGENYDLIYTTKKEINDALSKIKLVNPKDYINPLTLNNYNN